MADADGDGLAAGATELELLAGSTAQPAKATMESAMINASDVWLVGFIRSTSVTHVENVICVLRVHHSHRYFSPLGFGVTAGDTAGEGLAAGLGLVAGAVTAGLGEGLALAGVELASGSVAQPAANRIEESVKTRIALRLITVMFRVVILFVPRFSKIVKAR